MGNKVNPSERRKAPRFIIDQLVTLEMTRENFVQARGINISEQGIYCELDEEVEIPVAVFLLLTLDQGTANEVTIKCEGEVVRETVKEGHTFAAIQITSVDPQDEPRFKEFMGSLEK